MRLAALVLGAAAIVAAVLTPQKGDASVAVILGGDTDGYLSPCGCTFPMTGGIKRRASAIRMLSGKKKPIILENGGFVDGNSTQDEMKVRALVKALVSVGVTAINFGPSEARFGQAMAISMSNVTGGKVLSSSVSPSESSPLQETVTSRPFLIGAVSSNADGVARPLMERPVALNTAVNGVVSKAQIDGLKPIIMLQGSRDEAIELAKRFPDLALIEYRSSGDPPKSLERVGRTVIATPGEHGKSLVRLTYRNGGFEGYSVVRLTPDIADDKAVAKIYDGYLSEVGQADLLATWPRSDGPAYAGSASCAPCHKAASNIWSKSLHAHAFTTLEKEHHDKDPDCVKCHVVGLSSIKGFVSRLKTPSLANVGCESCHGPAKAHVSLPKLNRLPKVSSSDCMSCHTPLNSPRFDFPTYWAKIRH